MTGPTDTQPALGAAIRELRMMHGTTQQDTAQSAGITVAHLSRVERGRTNPTWDTVSKIADSLGVTIVEIAKRSLSQER